MGALAGLGVGVGILLVWSAGTPGVGRRRARISAASRVRMLLARAGADNVGVGGLGLLCGSFFLVVLAVVLLATDTLPVAGAFATMAAYVPVAALRSRAATRESELAECWPEAVDHLASAVRAGLSLGEALTGLGERGPAPLREPFARFARDYQASGRFGDALDSLKEDLADPTGDRVVEALRLAREVGGGDLGRVLRSLSGFLRDDLRTRGELVARQSWAVNGARLAVASPWVVLLLMSFQRDVIIRYSSGTGMVLLVIGAMVCTLAYRLMVRLGRLPAQRRVLA